MRKKVRGRPRKVHIDCAKLSERLASDFWSCDYIHVIYSEFLLLSKNTGVLLQRHDLL